jgi:hypothetical protein
MDTWSQQQKLAASGGLGAVGGFLLAAIIVAIVMIVMASQHNWEFDPRKWNASVNAGPNAGSNAGPNAIQKTGNAKANAANIVVVNSNATKPVVMNANAARNAGLVKNANDNWVPAADCQMGDWTEWSDCSADCGGGTQVRNRLVIKQAGNGGAACPTATESRTCNLEACPADYVPEHMAIDDFIRFTGAVPQSGTMIDVANPIPATAKQYTGQLIQATAEECQKYCAGMPDCDVVQFEKQILAFDGQSGCSLHSKHPAYPAVNVYVDDDTMLRDGSYKFDAYCREGICRKI